jgi:rhodanese-related sulfurtransferase
MRTFLVLAIFASAAFAADQPCNTKPQEKTTGTLIMVERRWVIALDNKDTKTLACLLAPEFTDSGVNGDLRDRATVLKDLPQHPKVEQHFRELAAVISGDTGIVRGINHVVLPNGRAADVRFTDTFVHREGIWQAVAAQETVVNPAETSKVGKDQRLDFEITPEELKKQLDAGQKIVVLDVREPSELQLARVANTKNIPMGDVPAKAHQELDPEEHIVVMCHHGVRSANVTAWLQQQGFEKVQSLQGGIDRWAKEIDTKVPTY